MSLKKWRYKHSTTVILIISLMALPALPGCSRCAHATGHRTSLLQLPEPRQGDGMAGAEMTETPGVTAEAWF